MVVVGCDTPHAPADSGSPDANDDSGRDDAGDTACVSVTGGGPEPWLDLEVVGSAFDGYEGARIRLITGSAGRVGVAHTKVRDGAFGLFLPRALNDGLYNQIGLYVDDNGNDACDVGEQQWGYVSGIASENLRIDATPETLCVSGGGPEVGAGCRAWLPQPEPCYVDGVVDIRDALSCPQ